MRHCCFIGRSSVSCPNKAEFTIHPKYADGPAAPDDYVDACAHHVGLLLGYPLDRNDTALVEWIVTPLNPSKKFRRDTALPTGQDDIEAKLVKFRTETTPREG